MRCASVLAFLTLLLFIAACEESEVKNKIAPFAPWQQRELASLIEKAKKEYLKAYRAEDASAARAARDKAIKAWLAQVPKVQGWLGRIHGVETTMEGNLIVTIDCGDFAIRNVADGIDESSPRTNTVINMESALANQILELLEGEFVLFDGIFICDGNGCIKELSLTEDGTMITPEFLMRFTRFVKWTPPGGAQ